MTRLHHVVLTRFAIQVADAPPSAAWVARRMELFRRYCLPSMQAQTQPAFQWRLYVHKDFDPAVADELRSCDPRIDVTTDERSPLPPTAAEVVISTRLDSDDALHATALATIERYRSDFLDTDRWRQMVRLRLGYHVDHQRQLAYVAPGRAFQSMFERGDERRGVLCESCDTINRTYPTWTVDEPLWARIVHGGNLLNRFVPGSRRLIPTRILSGFGCFPKVAA